MRKNIGILILGLFIGVLTTSIVKVNYNGKRRKLLDMAFVIDKEAVEHNLDVLYRVDSKILKNKSKECKQAYYDGCVAMYWKIFCGQRENDIDLPTPLKEQVRMYARNQEILDLAKSLPAAKSEYRQELERSVKDKEQ